MSHALRTAAGLVLLLIPACTSIHLLGGNGADPESECEPSPEICDGLDNDCNDAIDDGAAGTGIACDTGLPGSCAEGETACVDAALTCAATATGDELCDGLDNDCDGTVDEDMPWLPYDDGISGGNVSDVAFDARFDGVAYVFVGNRVFRSQDGGDVFEAVGEAADVLRQIAFPSDGSALLAASDDGLLRSDDDGHTWSSVALGGMALSTVLVHPADASRIYVGTLGAGIYRSTNGGESFDPVNAGVPFSNVVHLVGDPSSADEVVAAIQILDDQLVLTEEGRILRTTDAGDSWAEALVGAGRIFGLSRCDDEIRAACVGGLWRSANGGANWTLMPGLAGQWVHDAAFLPVDCDIVYASVYPTGVFRSSDGGAIFAGPLAAGMDVQHPGAVILAPSADRVLAANHSGVFASADQGASWARVSEIRAPLVRVLATSPTDPAKLWLGTWGQGVWERPTPDAPWAKLASSALPRDWSISIAPDPHDATRVLVGAWGDLWRTNDAGHSYTPLSLAPLNVFGVAYHPGDAQRIYIATQLGGVHTSADGGDSWTAFNAGLPLDAQDVRDVLVDPDDPDIVTIATHARGLFRSEAGGAWLPLDAALLHESTGCLIHHGRTLYTCVAGEGIWSSSDGVSFALRTQGIAELSNTTGLVADAATGDLYATSDAGVFRSPDGDTWEALDNVCLPAPAVSEPAIISHDGARQLVIATASGLLAHPLP